MDSKSLSTVIYSDKKYKKKNYSHRLNIVQSPDMTSRFKYLRDYLKERLHKFETSNKSEQKFLLMMQIPNGLNRVLEI